MPAANTDSFIKSAPLFSTTLSSGVDDSTTTIPLSSVSGLATDTAVCLTIDDRDADGNETLDTREVVVGVVSGSSLINCTRGVEGTAQSHSNGAVVVERITSEAWNRALGALLDNAVAQDGTPNPTVIQDANGNEQLEFSATSSAVSNLEVKNAATGNNPLLRAKGESNKGINLIDSNGNELLKLNSVASAVNELTYSNAATGNGPSFTATGETNVPINLTPAGTGQVIATNLLSKGKFINRVAKTNSNSPYSVTSTDDIVSVDASSGAVTVTLPTAASITGRVIKIVRTDATPANAVTVATTASQTIDGATTYLMYGQYEGIEVMSDGSNWVIVNSIPSAWTAFTPSWTNFTLGSGSETYRFQKHGKTVRFRGQTTLSSSTVGSSPQFAPPVPANTSAITNARTPLGQNVLDDANGSPIPGFLVFGPSAAQILLRFIHSVSGDNTAVGATSPFTWANSDIIHVIGQYEAA